MALAAIFPVIVLGDDEYTYDCVQESFEVNESEDVHVTMTRTGDLTQPSVGLTVADYDDGQQWTWAYDVPFAAGESSVELTYNFEDDTWAGTRHGTIYCSAPYQPLEGGRASVTVFENEPYPTFSVPATISVMEGAYDYINLTFQPGLGINVPLNATILEGTATSGEFWTGNPTLFPGWYPFFQVGGADDSVWEPNETFKVVFDGSGFHGETTVTIIDNDEPQPRFDAELYAFDEDDDVSILVERPGYTTGVTDLSLHLISENGMPWIVTNVPVHFDAGETAKTISIPVDDHLYSSTRTATLELVRSPNQVLSTATLTIFDDEPMPSLSIADIQITEGTTGTKNAVFTLTLTGPVTKPFGVGIMAIAGTATAPSDYSLAISPPTFNPGETTAQVKVPIIGDSVDEPDETFQIQITSCCSGFATVSRSTATCTIKNDDAVVHYTVFSLPASTPEASNALPVTIHRSGATEFDSELTLNVVPTVPAVQPKINPMTLAFSPGETSKTASVKINDSVYSGDRTVLVQLENGAVIEDSLPALIIEDESIPRLFLSDATATEAKSGSKTSFTLLIQPPYADAMAVDVSTSNGSAVAAKDFKALAKHVTVPAGTKTTKFDVDIIDDSSEEGDETFTLSAIALPPYGGTPVGLSATGVIRDNDGVRRTLSPDDEWTRAGSTLDFTIDVSAGPESAQTIQLSSSDPSKVSVPSQVTLAWKARSAIFTATALRRGAVTITATFPNGQKVTAKLNVFEDHTVLVTPQIVQTHIDVPEMAWISLMPASTSEVRLELNVTDPAIADTDETVVIPPGGTVAIPVRGLALGTTQLSITLPQDHGGTTIPVSVQVLPRAHRRGARH